MHFTATTTIDANPETIWSIITDAPNYPEWEPNVVRIEGTIALDEKVTAYTKRDPNRAFYAIVTEFAPNQKMVWTGGLPFGLFKGIRSFTLTPNGDSIDFTLHEEFSGLLLILFKRSIPDQTQDFQNFVQGLKERAEAIVG
jgi:hypothetical protein